MNNNTNNSNVILVIGTAAVASIVTAMITASLCFSLRKNKEEGEQYHKQSSVIEDDENMIEEWNRDGYVIVKNLLSIHECKRLEESVTCDGGIIKHSYGCDDGMGRLSRMALWNHPGNDVSGMVARIPRIRSRIETLLGGPVYHYHTKLMMKDAYVGGAHLWHQDYGYWVNNSCPYPDMGTVFIPIDKMTSDNGGLRIIRGSHKMGLIQHNVVGGQAKVDETRLTYAKELLDIVDLEMNPGDACFFHSLTLHCSPQNKSSKRRWAFLVAYNRCSNNPLIEHHHPQHTPLLPADDDAILNPATPLVDPIGKDFMDPNNDKSVQKYKEHGFH